MKACAFALLVTVAGLAVACGGGGDDGPVVVKTPSGAAPHNVIAFGAKDADGADALYLVQADGTGVQELQQEPQAVSFPRWSPDGARIAYVTGGGRGTGTEAALHVYNFDGAKAATISEHLLASGDEAPMSWSPDGKQIAFIDAEDGGVLRFYDIGAASLLDRPTVPASAVAWSAKNELAIVAPADDATTTDLFTLKPGDDKTRALLKHDGLEGAPAWSPDGKTLAFWASASGEIAERSLLLLRSGAKSAKDTGPGLDPSWSNGGRFTYSAPATAGARGILDIYVSDAHADKTSQVTRAVTRDRWPSWSPAEDAVTYVAQADASTSFLCTTTLSTLDNTCFDLPGLTPSAPSWSPY